MFSLWLAACVGDWKYREYHSVSSHILGCSFCRCTGEWMLFLSPQYRHNLNKAEAPSSQTWQQPEERERKKMHSLHTSYPHSIYTFNVRPYVIKVLCDIHSRQTNQFERASVQKMCILLKKCNENWNKSTPQPFIDQLRKWSSFCRALSVFFFTITLACVKHVFSATVCLVGLPHCTIRTPSSCNTLKMW